MLMLQMSPETSQNVNIAAATEWEEKVVDDEEEKDKAVDLCSSNENKK